MVAETFEQAATLDSTTARVWVAFGPVGVVGSIHEIGGSFAYRLMNEDYHGMFPSLEIAKSALQSALPGGSGVPEYREH